MRLTLSFLVLTIAALASAAGRIDVNTADEAILETLPGVRPIRAKSIVRMREQNGGFRCVEELRAIPRLTDVQFKKIRELVTTSGPGQRSDCQRLEEARRGHSRAE